ncbi:RNA-binding protein [Aeromonas caviae]|nr:RNA-binding protein [Aeromonas caviae]
METFLLEGHPFVALCDLIKHQGWADCGGAAKALVAEGLVEVDGQVETRKRCKIVAEQAVNFNGMKDEGRGEGREQSRDPLIPA